MKLKQLIKIRLKMVHPPIDLLQSLVVKASAVSAPGYIRDVVRSSR